ncbi:microsomal epoxide hydrolase [Purpureocillium lavendulum]|uniref:Microsomal epoxide hydrolase n=1 Tax=Purpureocillium lavendulum TaxID=1247861 RepID=A0AB34FTI7_9HYPO|nr:microsomal epoxide hydrolase [Purpureocillium lavendulum]
MAPASDANSAAQDPAALPPLPLPAGITSRFVDTHPFGLKFHVLEAIPEGLTPSSPDPSPPLILLIHGFPNLAYDWRFVMPGLARAGYYAVAFDMRGFGRTHATAGVSADGSPASVSSSLSFTPLAMVRDVVALVHALGYRAVHTLVGHDLGAFAAGMCALARSDMVRSLVLMAHPFRGPPGAPFATAVSASLLPAVLAPALTTTAAAAAAADRFDRLRDPDVHASLRRLDPPRQHYKWYNGSAGAADEWSYPQGEALKTFLRGYFHLKSADWAGNAPRPLGSWTAPSLAEMPHYYIMRAGVSMRDNVARDMADLEQEEEEEGKGDGATLAARLAATPWLPDAELDVYLGEWARTTFADALRWYAALTNNNTTTAAAAAGGGGGGGEAREAGEAAQLSGMLASRRIAVPTRYVSGVKDWGTYQDPGALEAMEEGESVEPGMYRGTVLLEGAGHWVNMERPDECVREILDVASMV